MSLHRLHAAIIGYMLLMLANHSLCATERYSQKDGFIIEDVVISSPDISLPDPEFSNLDFLFCWQDPDGRLWVGRVDPQTGFFDPPNGHGVLIDTDLMPTARKGHKSSFGPEWGFSRLGGEIYYTKKPGFLAKAYYNGEQWLVEMIPKGNHRTAPTATKNWEDPTPSIAYSKNVQYDKKLCWRLEENPQIEQCVKAPDQPSYRWVEGRQALLVGQRYNNEIQVALLDAQTGNISQLTFDSGRKGQAFMWRAPEFSDGWVMFAPVDKMLINVYLLQGKQWMLINTLEPPSSRPYILSAEFFVYNDKSYISMMLSESENSGVDTPSDIWIAAIDPANPLYRQVSEDSQPKIRKDPETLQTVEGMYIYYTEYTDGVKIIHRCSTGLGKPQLSKVLGGR